MNCKSLFIKDIPNSIKSIGEKVFEGCLFTNKQDSPKKQNLDQKQQIIPKKIQRNE